MKVAYFDCPTGVSGDMCLGALIDAGVSIEYLTQHLDRLGINQEYKLSSKQMIHNGQQATKAIVTLTHQPDHTHDHTHTRTLPEIEKMIITATLPDRAEKSSLEIFRNLAIAEGAVHGIPPEQVFFHEVGAVDAIVDIVGTCLGMDWLKIEQFYCSALPTGGGTIWAAHGRLPVPVPAVLKLFEKANVPVFYNSIDRELVTPTGAAIVTTLAHHFGHPPEMTIQKIALGAGTQELPIPNILRLWIGESRATHPHAKSAIQPHNHTHYHSHTEPSHEEHYHHDSEHLQTVAHLETQIDDLSPQTIAYTTEKLLHHGALDVFTTAIGMKKSRPGTLISVICKPEERDRFEQILFEETTTIGIRRSLQERSVLSRRFETIQIQGQPVKLKVAERNGKVYNIQPEYEDCAAIARHTDQSLKEIQRQVIEKKN
ncbi:MAG: nickel pincer cofactor biosynthesis protein LarC [Cyanobacteria bacterium]|nr:nickel pincer cofactor biosynthesis protein LarC [Cyanobacteriota bacterium]